MLIRSPRTPEVPDNIDLVFWGVRLVGIPTALTGIQIRSVSKVDLGLFGSGVGAFDAPAAGFSITSENQTYCLVADGCKVLRNQLDIFDSSLCYFTRSDATRSLGDVLAQS
jgi:hypothetical protein